MLKQNNCVKLFTAVTGLGDLEAGSGESFLVKGIFVSPSDNDTYLTIKIDNVTVGYYRLVGKSGNHLGDMSGSTVGRNLMRFLVNKGLPFSYPIAEGQKLSISRTAEAGKVQILYDRYDAGDIREDMPGGTASKIYGFLQYLRESAVLTESGDMELNTSITPAEFPDFPAGKAVPAKMRIKIHGIAGCPVADATDGSNLFYTSYLKLVREREVLCDEDRDGFLFWGNDQTAQTAVYELGKSIIGSGAEFATFNSFWANKQPLMFDPALVFESGEELLVYLTWVKVLEHTMPVNLADVALILEVNKE